MTEKEIEKIFKKHKSEISPKARFETLLWAVREYEENTETQASAKKCRMIETVFTLQTTKSLLTSSTGMSITTLKPMIVNIIVKEAEK